MKIVLLKPAMNETEESSSSQFQADKPKTYVKNRIVSTVAIPVPVKTVDQASPSKITNQNLSTSSPLKLFREQESTLESGK